jgi:tetratricopeptide (TPR) repeat protein
MKLTPTKCIWLLSMVGITSSITACTSIPFVSPNNPAAALSAFNQGVRLVSERQYQNALESFGDAIRLDPKLAQAYAWRAYVYNIQGNTSAAVSDCDSAIQLDPNLEQPYSTRARIKYLGQDYPNAIADSTKAVALNPKDVGAYSTRAFSYVRQKEYQKAIDDLTAALKVQAKNLPKGEYAAMYGYRGICNLALKNYDAAVDDCTTSLSYDDSVPQAYVCRGQAYKQLGKASLSKKDLDKYQQLTKAIQAKQPPPQLVPLYPLPPK